MDDLVKGVENMGISLTEAQQETFATFLHELKAYNDHTNLTAIRDDAGIIKKHFLDSLTVLSAIPKNATSLIDIGTGAGFPGLPIAIMMPNLQVTLLESIGKKTTFLNQIVEKLNLQNVTVINGRAEDVISEKNLREQFDVAVARAVAELRMLVEYTLPFVKVGGIFIAQKSAGETEVAHAQNALTTLGGKIVKQIPLADDRQLIIIEKAKATPADYPRRAHIIAKKPL